MTKKIITFAASILALTAPGLAQAHPGITSSQWVGHVLSDPFGAPDHILATSAIVFGLTMLIYRGSVKIIRLVGAALALGGVAVLILV